MARSASLLVLALIVTCLSTGKSVADERPNVVMIISDDQGFSDFGFMGNRVVQTPHLDALAARSARFTNGYVPSSVCRPSLVTLLTGLYPHQHGVHFNHPPPGFSKLTKTLNRDQYDAARQSANELIRGVETLPRQLAASGYRCLQTGKYWEGHWKNAGFTHGMTTGKPVSGATYGNKLLDNGEWVAHGNGDAGLAIGRQTMAPIHEFLDLAGEDPFFIWYAPFLPHLPHDSPRRFFELYDDSVPDHDRAYYAACSQFDETVGELINRVQQHTTPRKTLFVFVVDNGFRPDADSPMADGFGYNYTRRSKRSPFEDGLRTPILFALSGQTRPATHQMLCSSVDIMPTVLEACQIDISPTLSGRSLWKTATAQGTQEPRPVFGEIYPGDASVLNNPSADIAYRWVRDGDFKLIVPHLRDGKAWGDYVRTPELYNLRDDPKEQRNLLADPASRQTAIELRAKLDKWWSPN
ncbi:MAG: sulfatase-like hydrolase/transferase [Planctomycetales bacterium]|nr:sulfatase-like hydrolase/transferase [Planctomycetales bacterium]